MPKLTFINFDSSDYNGVNKTENIYAEKDKREKVHVTLDNVTTIKCTKGSLEDEKEWLIHALPNFRYLGLLFIELPSVYSQLASILNKRIKHLYLTKDSPLEQLTEINYFYFSNVQQIYFDIHKIMGGVGWYADNVMAILKNFKSLQILALYTSEQNKDYIISLTKELRRLIELPNKKERKENYQMKPFYGWIAFSKN